MIHYKEKGTQITPSHLSFPLDLFKILIYPLINTLPKIIKKLISSRKESNYSMALNGPIFPPIPPLIHIHKARRKPGSQNINKA